jgi:transcriptional regulator with XRE-family HTH domain
METLKYIRALRGFNQSELAKASGVAQNTISEIETGHRRARPATLRKLAAALDVEVEDFYREPEELAPKASTPLDEVREAYQPHASGLANYCKRWEEILERPEAPSRELVEEFVLTAVNLTPFLMSARTGELERIGEALIISETPFSSEDLQERSVLGPAFDRYYRLMRELPLRLEPEARADILADLEDLVPTT